MIATAGLGTLILARDGCVMLQTELPGRSQYSMPGKVALHRHKQKPLLDLLYEKDAITSHRPGPLSKHATPAPAWTCQVSRHVIYYGNSQCKFWSQRSYIPMSDLPRFLLLFLCHHFFF